MSCLEFSIALPLEFAEARVLAAGEPAQPVSRPVGPSAAVGSRTVIRTDEQGEQ